MTGVIWAILARGAGHEVKRRLPARGQNGRAGEERRMRLKEEKKKRNGEYKNKKVNAPHGNATNDRFTLFRVAGSDSGLVVLCLIAFLLA